MGHRGLVVVHIQGRGDRLGGQVGVLNQQSGEVVDAAMEAVDLGVDLDAIAGGDDHSLVDVFGLGRGPSELACAVSVDGELLEHVDRRTAVGGTDDKDAHRAPASSAPRPCALRCSW